jgi:hypothetical protein
MQNSVAQAMWHPVFVHLYFTVPNYEWGDRKSEILALKNEQNSTNFG